MRILTHSRARIALRSLTLRLAILTMVILGGISSNVYSQCDITCPLAATTLACDADFSDLFTTLGGATTDCGTVTVTDDFVHPGACGGDVVVTYTVTSDNGTPLDDTDDIVDTSCSTAVTVTEATVPTVTPPVAPAGPLSCDEAAVFMFTEVATYTNSLAAPCEISGDLDPVVTPAFTPCDGGTITISYSGEDACGNVLTAEDIIIDVLPAPLAILAVPDPEPPATLTCDEADAFTWTVAAMYTNSAEEDACLDMGEVAPTVTPDWDACLGGTITIEYIGEDACGNELTIEPYVIAVDPAPVPTLTMPVIVAGPMTCDAAEAFTFTTPASYTNMGMGACLIAGEIMPAVTKEFDACAGGTITIEFEGEDACGNALAAPPTVITVLAAPEAMVTPPDGIPTTPLTCDEAAAFAFTAEATYTNMGAGGPDCEIALSNCCLIEGTIAPVVTPAWTLCDGGTITIEYDDTDACGNAVTVGPFEIAVLPAEAPIFLNVPPDEIYACDAVPPVSDLVYSNSALEADCLIQGMETSVQTAHPGPCGGEITETWTLVADPTNCLTADLVVERVITVLPAAAPIFLAVPADMTLECGDALPPAADLTYTNNSLDANCLITGTAPGVDMMEAGCAIGLETITRTWTVPAADDCEGVGITASQTITFLDTMDPIFNADCADVMVSAVAECEAVATFPDPTAMDCDPAVVITQTGGPVSGSTFPVGSTPVTFTATDCSGNSEVCTFNIIVTDDGDPMITCPAGPIMVPTDMGLCTWTADNSVMYASAIDNCPDFTITHEITGATVVPAGTEGSAVGTVFLKGTSTVTYTITDGDGVPMATCSFDVVVEDMELPLCPIISAPVPVVLDPATDEAMITVDDVDGGFSDNCEIVSATLDQDLFTCADLFTKVGRVLVTVTLEDCGGNVVDCFVEVEVSEDVDPECMAMDITIQLDADGEAVIVPADIDAGSADNCTPVSLSAQPLEFTCDNIGDNTVTLSVTDCDLNQSLCTATVTVEDITLPICATQNITAQLDENGVATITAEMVDDGSTDECCLESIDVTPSVFSCANVGFNPVTFTATDCEGNVSVPCLALVNVEDNVLPDCEGIDQTVYLDDTGTAFLSTPDVAMAADNCGVGSVAADPLAFTCDDASMVVTTTITVTDVNGNESVCTADITVLDFVAPTCVPLDGTFALDADGIVEITVGDVDGGSFDNCMPVEVVASPLAFNCDDVGDNIVTLSVTDPSGNNSVCQATVTIEDNEAPDCTAIDVEVFLDQDGEASLTIDDVAMVEDNCCVDMVSAAPLDFTCADVPGPVAVLIMAEDCNGNALAAPCEAMVTVTDTLAPMCTPGSVTVDLAMEECEGPAVFVLPDPVDNCDGAPTIIPIPGEPVSGDIFPSGVTEIRYEVSDADMNTDTCVFTVIVNEFPLSGISCQNINLSLDETCSGSITPLQVLTGSNFPCLDNCEITITDPWGNPVPNDFGPDNVGETYQYMICCNGLCCWGEVQVDYKLPPRIFCPEDTIIVACNGLETVDESLVLTEFCADGELVLLSETFDNLHCDDEYLSEVTRVYQAIDEFGNESPECEVNILLERVDLDLVECPESKLKSDGTALSCSEDYPLDEYGHPAPYDPATGEGCGVPVYVVPAEIEFEDSGAMIGNLASSAVKLCDLNGDGFDDLFSVNYFDVNKVYFGDGLGNFVDSGQSLGLADTRDVALADVDGDGDKDAIFSNLNTEDMVWLNDGTGYFTDSGQMLGAVGDLSSNVDACDVDGDGDEDLIITNFFGNVTVYFNDGAGDFTTMSSMLMSFLTNAVVLEDVDSDGDKDAIIIAGGTHVEIWLNNGSGGFANSGQTLGTGDFTRPDICDLDGDGDLDIFAPDAVGSGAQVFLNDGAGVFSDTGQNLGTALSSSVSLFDIDCDGDKDAFLANFGPNTVFLNDGTGFFTDTGLAIGATNDFEALTTDLDGDGDLDIITANFGGPNMIWTNNSTCERRLDLYPDVADELCNVYVSYTDIEIPAINCVTKIMRSWTINEWWCGSELSTGCFQMIEIADTEGPAFDCPAPFNASTVHDCEGQINFPDVDAVDNCSEIGGYLINWGHGSLNTNGGIGNAPIGVHTVTYEVFDECYNSTSCETTVTVSDSTEPVALCEQNTVVSIGTTPYAVVYATTFDDGSYDDCYIDSIGVRRMSSPCVDYLSDTLYYDEKVHFCCADVGVEDIMVQLRVWDKSGNFNDCMINVEVQDKIAPSMTCIDDVTIECDDPVDLDNLGLTFGYPDVTDNCAMPEDLRDEVTDNRNQCGTGTIERRIILEDTESVTIQECLQTITVVSDNPFLYGDIFWPRDTTFSDLCSIAALDPSNLPDGYNKPYFIEEQCQQVGYNHDDQVFEFVQGDSACIKIIRTWKVIDWCQPLTNGNYVTFSREQVLKVNNTVAPEIIETCIDTTITSSDPQCSDVQFNWTATASDDCTPAESLTWSYEIDLNTDGSINEIGDTDGISRDLPAGTHTIYWRVEDQCGNFDVCEHTVTVYSIKDPTPICIHGLSVDLIPMDLVEPFGELDNEMVTLWASDFDKGSYHPCGYDVVVSFSDDPNDTNVTYDCNSCGIQVVELWVTAVDENGDPVTLPDGSFLQAWCETFVDVQDNNNFNFCDPNDCQERIVGRIATEEETVVPNVEVSLDGAGMMELTDENGLYSFGTMEEGGNYEVVPFYDQHPLNGVTTLDIVHIQRHVLGLDDLDSCYDLIAADANNSGNITAQDLVDIRRLILGLTDAFPNNTSWRFIDAQQVFVDPNDPWSNGIDETYTIGNYDGNMIIDFIGVKTADVNGSVTMFHEDDTDTRNADISFEYIINKDMISVYATSIDNIKGFQMSLDVQGMNVVDVTSELVGFDETAFFQAENELRISYANAAGTGLTSGMHLFDIQLDNTIDVMALGTEMTAEAYVGESLDIQGIELVKGVNTTEAYITNYPNPWLNETVIEFNSLQAGQASLIFYDAKGAQEKIMNVQLTEGLNMINIPRSYFSVGGVKTYQLMIGEDVHFGKMLLLE